MIGFVNNIPGSSSGGSDNSKLDKSTKQNIVYATDDLMPDAQQIEIEYSVDDNYLETIPVRTQAGQLSSITLEDDDPTADPFDLVNRGYIQDKNLISEAPNDGKHYVRRYEKWEEIFVPIFNLENGLEIPGDSLRISKIIEINPFRVKWESVVDLSFEWLRVEALPGFGSAIYCYISSFEPNINVPSSLSGATLIAQFEGINDTVESMEKMVFQRFLKVPAQGEKTLIRSASELFISDYTYTEGKEEEIPIDWDVPQYITIAIRNNEATTTSQAGFIMLR